MPLLQIAPAPKAVSVLCEISRDERILDAFKESYRETLADAEVEMKTRVRKGGRDEDRVTGNMVGAEFIHFTARPVKGVLTPHLHAHCVVYNVTWDSEEGRWKASQQGDLCSSSMSTGAIAKLHASSE